MFLVCCELPLVTNKAYIKWISLKRLARHSCNDNKLTKEIHIISVDAGLHGLLSVPIHQSGPKQMF